MKLTVLSPNIYAIGTLKKISPELLRQIRHQLQENRIDPSVLFTFKKIFKNKFTFASDIQNSNKISPYISYLHNDVKNLGKSAISAYDVVQKCTTTKPFKVTVKNIEFDFVHQISSHDEIVLVDVKKLKSVCFYIDVSDINKSYIVEPVNSVDKE